MHLGRQGFIFRVENFVLAGRQDAKLMIVEIDDALGEADEGAGVAGERMEKVNVPGQLARIREHWKPRIAGELNGQHVKLVKFQGPFLWHHHDSEDELFYVVAGRFRMEFRDRPVWLEKVPSRCASLVCKQLALNNLMKDGSHAVAVPFGGVENTFHFHTVAKRDRRARSVCNKLSHDVPGDLTLVLQ